MRARWEGLRQSFVRFLSTLKADVQFHHIRGNHANLSAFSGSDALVAFLTTDVDEAENLSRVLDRKDRIYRNLVHLVQAKGVQVELATAILWLGLWPGLDAVFRHRQGDFAGMVDELVTEISFVFSDTVARIDLAGVNRVAATLVRNVERDVRERLKRRWSDNAQAVDVEDPVVCSTEPCLLLLPSVAERALPVDTGDVVAVRDWLSQVCGTDAELVVGVALFGFDLHEMADYLGIGHEAARKRYQRAVVRIREQLEKASRALSQSAQRNRVYFA